MPNVQRARLAKIIYRTSICVALASAVTGAQLASARANEGTEIKMTAAQAASLGVRTMRLGDAGRGADAAFPAKAVIPNAQLRVLSASLAGIVESVRVSVNEPVSKGQVLAEIKSPSLIGEQREFLQALSQAQVARTAMARDNELLKEGIIASSRHQATRATAAQAQAELEEKRQSLLLFGLSASDIKALQSSRKLSTTLHVTSPISGYVLEQFALVGQHVEAAAPLYKIGSVSPLWLEIQMPPEHASRVQQGATVTVRSVGARGQVISVGRSLQAANQTVMVRALIDKDAAKLRPEEMVVAAVETIGAGHMQWRLPLSAVVRHDGVPHVFVKTPAGFRAQEVTVESENATTVTIRSPLKQTDNIAVEGMISLKGAWQELGGGN